MFATIGRPVPGRPFDIDEERSHRFFSKTNLLVFGVSLLGMSADAITTQRFVSRGQQEQDPIARPFVDQGWPGQLELEAADTAAQIFIMYRLHKMGHHRIEKLVPLAMGIAGGQSAYHNLQHE